MPDFKFDPFNPEHVSAFRACDACMASFLKPLPTTGDEIQFKFPDIRSDPGLLKGAAYLLAPRRPDESDEEWASRCVKITNIGDPNESSHE